MYLAEESRCDEDNHQSFNTCRRLSLRLALLFRKSQRSKSKDMLDKCRRLRAELNYDESFWA
jgi:hypothetical protein